MHRVKIVAMHLGLLTVFLVPVTWSQATAKQHWDSAGLSAARGTSATFKAQLVLTQPLQERTNQFGATSYQAPAEVVALETPDGQIHEVVSSWPVWMSSDKDHAAIPGSIVRGIIQVEAAGTLSRIQAYAGVRGTLETVEAARPTVFTAVRSRLQDLAHRHQTGVPTLDRSRDQQRGRALIASMIVGDTSAHDEQLRADMKTAGLSHLSAVSGANCALVFGVVTTLFRRLGSPRWLQIGGSLCALVLFVLVVGTEPSVLRAAVMGIVGAIAVFSGRGRKTMPLLFVACLLLLTVDPWYATDLAFQLSVAATWGIVAWGRSLSVAFPSWIPKLMAQALSVAIAAQVATIPVLGPATGSVPTHSVVANLIVTPLVPLVTLLGTASLPFLLWFPELSTLMLYPVGWLTMAVGFIGHASARLPYALLPWPEGLGGYLLGFVVLVVFGAGTHLMRRKFSDKEGPSSVPRIIRYRSLWGFLRFRVTGSSMLWLAVVGVATSLIMLGWLLRPHGIPRDWSMAVCDVGQGDMFVLNSGDAAAVVVDAGPDPVAADKCLRQLGVTTIEHAFISHQHADHYAGMEGVIRERQLKAVSYGSAQEPLLFPSPGATAQRARLGDEWTFAADNGRDRRLQMRVLGARQDPGVSENDASLILHATFEPTGTTVLFTGDVEEDEFASLLRNNRIPDRVHVLKVAHHGARNGGQQAAEHLGPDLALISVGRDNDYGHPHPDIVAAFDSAGTKLMRTDELGSIWIRFSEHSFVSGQF